MVERGFEVVCEIEPATSPDLTRVRHQIGVLAPVASSFLIPDNHIGRATVSSVAVAHEVQAMGGRAVACLNARDRNLLGFVEADPDAGVDAAVELIDGIEASGGFAGVHLVPVSRYRQVAARLEQRRS